MIDVQKFLCIYFLNIHMYRVLWLEIYIHYLEQLGFGIKLPAFVS